MLETVSLPPAELPIPIDRVRKGLTGSGWFDGMPFLVVLILLVMKGCK